MQFTETPLKGAYLIDLEKRGDERGFFARAFCVNEFVEHRLESDIKQINISTNAEKGTLRGMHYQLKPHAEVKMVRCVSGSLFDVILDLRPESETFGKSFGAELSAENRRLMYVPRGFAHGFITLTTDAEAFYLVTSFYSPGAERGVRWNDPEFAIDWPIEPKIISDKDKSWPDFDPGFHLK